MQRTAQRPGTAGDIVAGRAGTDQTVAGPAGTDHTVAGPAGTDHTVAGPAGTDHTVAEDNSHAGQGSVLLDIGGEIGALVLHAGAALEGVEIEIRPTGDTPFADGSPRSDPGDHDHEHHAGHEHDHQHSHPHAHGSPEHGPGGQLDGHRLLHVAVLRRPAPSGARFAAVFPELHAGTYELYRRPAEPVALTVSIVGARVTEASWPDGR